MPPYGAPWRVFLTGIVVFGWQLLTASSFAGRSCSATNTCTCSLPSTFVKPRRTGSSYIGGCAYVSRSAICSSLSNQSDSANSSNIIWLQQRFELPDEWALKTSRSAIGKSIDTLDRAVVVVRIDFLQKRLKPSQKELATIIQKAPGLLNYRSDENVGPKIDFLSERLGLGTKAISKMVQGSRARILFMKKETLQKNLKYIESRICLNDTKKVATVVKRCPVLLTYSIDENLEPTVIKFQKYFGFDDSDVSAVFTRFPNLLGLDFDTSIKARIEWFRETVRANVEEITKIVKKQPILLYLSVDSLESNNLWLKKRLQVDDKTLKKMIVRMPSILYYSPEENLEPTMQWLESEFGSSAKFMVQKFPPLLGCNVTTNTEPTLMFYVECVGEEKAKAMIIGLPAYLGYSLENRLKPRLEEAQKKGMVVDSKLMNKIALFTKEKWEKELQNSE